MSERVAGFPSVPTFKNALTIDVEEWYDTFLFSKEHTRRSLFKSDLPRNIDEILLLLSQHRVQATFFVLGTVAERYPKIIHAISQAGHEIASHGYQHTMVYQLSPSEFKDDVKRSLNILESITGTQIKGYRAPTWSIFRNMGWAIDILQELGLKYDSSIYPVSKSIFTCHKVKTSPYLIKGNFVEFPPSIFKLLGYNLPFSGGTFLRFFPNDFICKKILDINDKELPAMVYFHSWEFDHCAPIPNILYWKRLIQYGNAGTIKAKFLSVLHRFRFSSMQAVLRDAALLE